MVLLFMQHQYVSFSFLRVSFLQRSLSNTDHRQHVNSAGLSTRGARLRQIGPAGLRLTLHVNDLINFYNQFLLAAL